MNFVFFGGEPLAVPVLNKLKENNLIPSLIVCNPDRRSGRGQKLTSPPAKIWAEAEGIEVFQPTSYKDDSVKEKLSETDWELFVVVAYNFILPAWLLEIPQKGVLNVHPSLLPKLRGASPIRTAILNNLPDDVGVTIMLMDKEMDHGPILEQEQLILHEKNWPLAGDELDKILADLGGELLSEVIQAWVHDELSQQEQDHSMATYCSKLDKAQAELNINPQKLPSGREATKILHTVYAFSGIGDTYFIHNGKRVKIKKASLTEGGSLLLQRVVPEGKKEIDFTDYLKTYGSAK
ncbi:methionyl-tRNA formyltransferase [Candidatus Nomurabacteria bacterium]|nr:methionyl-tRNA formyltransferase [Candidatus Nomurabacteria bacterium]